MKKKEGFRNFLLCIFGFLLILTFSYFIIASNPAISVWNISINGPQNKSDMGQGVAIDNNSNIYVVGGFYVDF